MEEEREEFVINNDNTADWAVSKIKEEEAERDRLLQICQAKRQDIAEQEQAIIDRCDNATKYLKSQLHAYFVTVPHKETKTQETYKLVSGSLFTKKATKKMQKVDEDVLVNYLKDSGFQCFIKTKESADWSAFKKTLTLTEDGEIITEDGEVVPAAVISVEDVPESFDIK